MKNSRALFLGLLVLAVTQLATAQNDWIPQKEKENVSIFTFDDDFARQGEVIYKLSCTSCHGNPTENNYTPMSPSPGDLSQDKAQNQKDGELYYMILKGRNAMPSFEDALSAEEIWSLVAYLRSFNESYEQPKPNLEGIEIPELSLQMSYDDNVDKLVIKVFDDKQQPVEKASVSAFVKGMFGNFLLGKSQTNTLGIAYFDVDSKLPGDWYGKVDAVVKATKGYGSKKATETISIAQPTYYQEITDGRHLWSTVDKAPLWLIGAYSLTMIGIWAILLIVILGLRKLKKLN